MLGEAKRRRLEVREADRGSVGTGGLAAWLTGASKMSEVLGVQQHDEGQARIRASEWGRGGSCPGREAH
jgi:hypothetical protein